jgi:antitoxin VapB
MTLDGADIEIDALAQALAERRQQSKEEVVRQALRNELRREGDDALVDIVVALCRRARSMGDPDKGLPVDKAFRDSLYE